MRESADWRMTRGNEEYWTGNTLIEARRGHPDTGQWWSLNSMSFFLYSTSRPDHAPVAKRHGVNALIQFRKVDCHLKVLGRRLSSDVMLQTSKRKKNGKKSFF